MKHENYGVSAEKNYLIVIEIANNVHAFIYVHCTLHIVQGGRGCFWRRKEDKQCCSTLGDEILQSYAKV